MPLSFSPPVRARGCTAAIATAAALVTTVPQFSASDPVKGEGVVALERYLARPSISLQYRAARRLEASGVGQRGWLDVQTVFIPSAGLQYEVTAEGGSGYIRGRVLRTLLDEEQRVIALGATRKLAISSENYIFTPEGVNEEGLAVVRMKPRRKERSLIDGRIYLTTDDGELVRLEGRLAKSPSFWVSRVNVVRLYRRINGVPMPVSLETTARLRLLGSSSLRMIYCYLQIDEQPVRVMEEGKEAGCADARRVSSPDEPGQP